MQAFQIKDEDDKRKASWINFLENRVRQLLQIVSLGAVCLNCHTLFLGKKTSLICRLLNFPRQCLRLKQCRLLFSQIIFSLRYLLFVVLTSQAVAVSLNALRTI